jgi:hypothetical protein
MSLNDFTGQNLVFIIGCPRSGTTYLQKLLASHENVHTGWESYVFAWYLGPLIRNWREKDHVASLSDEVRRKGLGSYLQEKRFYELARGFVVSMVGNLPKGHLFVEKTPEHSLWIPEIVELLPESRFINIIRDGRDVVASLLATSRTWGKRWAPRYAFTNATLWVKYVQAIEKARQLVRKENFFDIKYEDLCANPVEKLESLSRFLKLQWDDTNLREAVKENDLQQARRTGGTHLMPGSQEFANLSGKVFQDPEGFIRKGQPGAWKKDLKFYEKWQVWLIAHRTMGAAGYPWKYPW